MTGTGVAGGSRTLLGVDVDNRRRYAVNVVCRYTDRYRARIVNHNDRGDAPDRVKQFGMEAAMNRNHNRYIGERKRCCVRDGMHHSGFQEPAQQMTRTVAGR